MIIGAHSIISSLKPEKDRAFLRDVLKFPFVDSGGGWLIYGLPPSEVAIHPAEKNDIHEFYIMVDDIEQFVIEMKKKKVPVIPVEDCGWGLLTHITLPGGGKLGVYQPRHARPESMLEKAPAKKIVATEGKRKVAKKKVAKKAAKKKSAHRSRSLRR